MEELINTTAAKEFNFILNEAPPEIRYQLIDWWHNWVSLAAAEASMEETAYNSLNEDAFEMAKKMMVTQIGQAIVEKAEIRAELITPINEKYSKQNFKPFYLFRATFMVLGRKKNADANN